MENKIELNEKEAHDYEIINMRIAIQQKDEMLMELNKRLLEADKANFKAKVFHQHKVSEEDYELFVENQRVFLRRRNGK